MSRYIAAAGIRGAHQVVNKADEMYKKAIEQYGPDAPINFVDKDGAGTTFYVPVIYAYSGHKIEKLGDIAEPLEYIKKLAPPIPSDSLWMPYLGELADSGMATLWGEEIIKAIEFVEGKQPEKKGDFTFNGPISDAQTRSWGIQLVDGSMPGFAAILGSAKSNEVAVKIVRELQSRGILVFLASTANGRSIVDQLLEEGVELGYPTFTVPFGSDTESMVYALGFAARSSLSFGGVKAGNFREILLYNKFRCFAFALALGQMDDVKWATGAGAILYGFPAILDTVAPQILATGITQHEHVISMPFDDIPAKDDLERAEKLVQRCIEVRGIKIKIAKVPIPVAYGPAFEGEVVRRENMYCEYRGGKGDFCFEWLSMKDADEVEDGKIEIIGPDVKDVEVGSRHSLAIIVEVAGRKMQKDFEPVLERQIHHFVNGAEGIQHIGQRDITWIRFSKGSVDKGWTLKNIGDILHTMYHNSFGAIVDKVQVSIYTDKEKVAELIEKARAVYRERDERMAGMTDEAVDTYYSCTLCQSFAPNHVCVVNPERTGLCGAYSWLDCRAAFEINPTGPNQPVLKGRCIDDKKGEWEGVNKFVFDHSQRNVERFTFYSLMDSPMTTCGCCECVMMLVPEANGVMIVSRDDNSMTPCGMTFTTCMGTVGGGQQTPGMMGHSKRWVLSKKFIPYEGGIKRVVWLSKNIKEEFAEELKATCEREGVPDLMGKIADGTVATTVDELLPFLQEKGHPALSMESII